LKYKAADLIDTSIFTFAVVVY